MPDPVSSSLLIRTKLHPPRLATRVVERQRLFELLDEGAELPLTLVSAPAGYGKSTLVASWLSVTKRPTAWLSLDERDSDLTVFLRYLLAAIDSAAPGACPEASALLRVAELPAAAAIASVLTNELDDLDDHLVLVLDDYHLIHDGRIHDLLRGLLRHPPRSLHVVVLTRADPPLALATARQSGMLVEVRAKDLGFTAEEAESLLAEALDPSVARVALSRLLTTTEGWPVGLRLAALSLRGRPDPEPILARIEGNAMWAGAALVAEVLSTLPTEYQECLLRISLVDRFCAPLCEALCSGPDSEGQPGRSGEEFLSWLERSDLFIIALDDDHEWFRFHHLFRDLLRRRLGDRMTTEAMSNLHRKAGAWFEAKGLLEEALSQYLAGGHETSAAELVRRHRHGMMNREDWARLDGWLRRLPARAVQSNIELLVQSAWICENRYRYDEMLELLDTIEARTAESESPALSELVNGEIEALRAVRCYFAADARGAVTAADRALDAIPPDHPSQRGFALVVHGFANQMLGESDHAVASCLDAMQDPRIRGTTLHARILIGLCFIHWMDADLERVIRVASELLALGQEHDLPESVSFARYFLGVAHLDRGDLDSALAALLPEFQQKAPPNATNHWYSALGLALALDGRGESERAHEIASKMAARAFEIQNSALIALAEGFEAELAVRHGELSRALLWAQSFQPMSRGTWWRFFLPELTFAKAFILEARHDGMKRAEELLDALHDHFTKTHNRRFLVDVELLLAVVRCGCGDLAAAETALQAAVEIARPCGLLRPFRELGSELTPLLDGLAEGSDDRKFIGSIIAPRPKPGVERSIPAPGIEALTNRELDILELLAERLTNKEIAARLAISHATVRTHTSNIYQKLGVSGRRGAVTRAATLGILRSH